jgi:hypothetical protein
MLRAFCHRTRTILNSGSFSFLLVRTVRLHCIKSPNQISLIIKFKSHNLSVVQIRIRIVYDSVLRQSANSARDCIQMAVTIVVVTENMRISMR